MNEEKIEQLSQLNNNHLPVLPAGIPELLSLLTNEDTTFEQLSESIEKFPSITARLLAAANSAWSSPVEPIESLQIACSRLGFSVVKNISIALAVASPFTVHQCSSFNISRFWCRSLLVADISSALASLVDPGLNNGMIRTAGLLHNLGLLWLADQLPTEINQAFEQHMASPEESLSQILNANIGYDYADAGAFLASAWFLPGSLIDAIAHHTNADKYLTEGMNTSVIGHSVEIAQVIETEVEDLEPMISTLCSAFDISPKEATAQINKAKKSFSKNQALAQTLF